MSFIDAEKLTAKIEKEINRASKKIHAGKNDYVSAHYRGEVSALFTVKSFITSLQQKSPELDVDTLREWSMRYAPDIRSAIEATAYHFWNKALNARKEEVK